MHRSILSDVIMTPLNHAPTACGSVPSQANFLQDHPEDAEGGCRDASLNLTPAEAEFAMGNALVMQQKVVEAIACYQSAVQLQPGLWEAHYNLATALAHLGNADAAIAAYQRVTELQPDCASAYRQLGQIFEQQGQWQAALEAYLPLLQLESQQPTLCFALGQLYFKLGQYAAAAAMLQQSVQGDPTLTWAYHNWIESLIRLQQWQAAAEVCQMALAAGHAFPWLYTLQGRILTLQHQDEAAAVWYEQGCILRGWHQFGQKHYHFTQDWFSHNIPIWTEFLQPLANRAALQILEIGSYQGMSACWLLDQILTDPTARLTCIDLNFQPRFQDNLAKTGAVEKVTVLMGDSHALLPTLNPHQFDVIYIDGCHWAEHVQQDAELAWPLLKPEGLMIFDDYAWQDPAHPGRDPQLGIDAFVNSRQAEVATLHQEYQLILRKLSA